MSNNFNLKNTNSNIKIIIGENGTGKSALLNELSLDYLNDNKTVIAIATSIHDKFTSRRRKFHFYGGRQGRSMVERAIKKSLLGDSNSDVDRVKYLIIALEYAKYSPRIGIKVEGFEPDNIESLYLAAKEDERIYDVFSLIKKYHEPFSRESVVAISLWAVTKENNNVSGSALSAFIRYEKILKKYKIIKRFRTYLYREDSEIALANASSGELMIISMLVHISSYIDKDTVILIDEPENSLHPRWQRKYIDMILDVFYLFQPKIYVASHSPQIIPIDNDLYKIFTPKNGVVVEVDEKTSNNEELLSEVFGVITPENRFLSNKMVETINNFDAKNIEYNDALQIIEGYKNKVYDPRQITFLEGVNEIIEKINNSRTSDA
ncbi:TPA: ATP-binding protein [Vibrio cholerae]|uniref:AAA family ATPase n=1 Tax=Vibrio cholerae TaxID=666 RepID=UPI000F4071A3|nr:AAA family ATPase [Vibrio cholerae]RNE75325.1 ATP-binding protein [Vibrio cholerae]TXY62985.1 ATP-binding protein [Vibrio cholerae]GHX55774.1 AAA domain protein [Vibrio cholerae]HBC3996901.1 ATP-binding protein [Vibrio cholerae]HDZ9256230.1 ATP-binding protein [Vibrio cholerae]